MLGIAVAQPIDHVRGGPPFLSSTRAFATTAKSGVGTLESDLIQI